MEEARQAKAFVKRKINWFIRNENDSATRTTLAKLRRGIGKPPGSTPELWEATLKDLPQEIFGQGQDPSYGEWAVHTALTLYALHQQGKDLKLQCMSKEGDYLGIALRKLISDEQDEKRIKRRFDAVLTSSSMEEFAHHLRGLIQLMRAKSISLDYPALTEDLFWLQFSDARDSIRLRWGRDFYRNISSGDEEKSNEDQRKDEENEIQ